MITRAPRYLFLNYDMYGSNGSKQTSTSFSRKLIGLMPHPRSNTTELGSNNSLIWPQKSSGLMSNFFTTFIGRTDVTGPAKYCNSRWSADFLFDNKMTKKI